MASRRAGMSTTEISPQGMLTNRRQHIGVLRPKTKEQFYTLQMHKLEPGRGYFMRPETYRQLTRNKVVGLLLCNITPTRMSVAVALACQYYAAANIKA